MLSSLHALQRPHCCMLTCTDNSLQLYDYTLIMLNNSDIAACRDKTVAIVSSYYLFKLVCNRRKMLMKNSSKIFKLFKHDR